jgi:hypothetical protein
MDIKMPLPGTCEPREWGKLTPTLKSGDFIYVFAPTPRKHLRIRWIFSTFKLSPITVDVYVNAKAIQFIHSMYMCMQNLFNLYIRCTCVSESYSIYKFDVHVYAKAIQFIHSMYMCMQKLFNLYIRCTCVCETYSIYTFDVHAYAKTIQFIHSMYMCTCVCESYSI